MELVKGRHTMRRCIGLVVLAASVAATWAAAPPVKGSNGFTQEQMAWLICTLVGDPG